MAIRYVGIGETSSCRYIGVEPPLDDAVTQRLLKVVAMPPWIVESMGYTTHTVPETPPYTEFGMDAGAELDLRGREAVDAEVVELARVMGRVLAAEGDVIVIYEQMIPTDFEHPLFGPEADHTREAAAQPQP